MTSGLAGAGIVNLVNANDGNLFDGQFGKIPLPSLSKGGDPIEQILIQNTDDHKVSELSFPPLERDTGVILVQAFTKRKIITTDTIDP